MARATSAASLTRCAHCNGAGAGSDAAVGWHASRRSSEPPTQSSITRQRCGPSLEGEQAEDVRVGDAQQHFVLGRELLALPLLHALLQNLRCDRGRGRDKKQRHDVTKTSVS